MNRSGWIRQTRSMLLSKLIAQEARQGRLSRFLDIVWWSRQVASTAGRNDEAQAAEQHLQTTAACYPRNELVGCRARSSLKQHRCSLLAAVTLSRTGPELGGKALAGAAAPRAQPAAAPKAVAPKAAAPRAAPEEACLMCR